MGLEDAVAEIVISVFRVNLAQLVLAGLTLAALGYIGEKLGFYHKK